MSLTQEDEKLAAHLQAMIRCATVSNSDVNKVDWQEFEKLHALFEKFYPHIYQLMELDKVGQAGLQFHLKGTGSGKQPLLLMSHQDVVEIGDRSQWKFDPFSGDIIDGCVCGRGTTDCKNLLLSELEAVENLLAQGWRPDYDLYLSLGYAEEVYLENDTDAAQRLAENLEKKGIRIGTIFDEGGFIQPEKDGWLSARIGLGEKTAVNYEIYKDSPGGHSSKPGAGTALGAVAKAIVNIETHPFPYRLTPLAKDQLIASAPLQPEGIKEIYADPEGRWEDLCALAKQNPALDALLHTTIAFTMASASTQPNVLPSHAAAGFSVRVLQGDIVESVQKYFTQFLPEGVKIKHISGLTPTPTSTPDSHAFRLTEKILHEMYGEKVLMIPVLMLGATDTRYYRNVSQDVLRFSAHKKDARWGEAHQVNEKIPMDALRPSVEFFEKLLKLY